MAGNLVTAHRRFTVALIVMNVVVGQAQAANVQAFRFGKDLVVDCAGRDLDFCAGYIAGIADLMTSIYTVTGNPKFRACLPPGTTPAELVKVVVKFMAEQKSYEGDASGSVFFAIRDKFPCPGA